LITGILYNPIAMAFLCFIAGALVGSAREIRRKGSGVEVVLTSLAFGFMAGVAGALLTFVGIMVMWGMSVS